MLLLTGATGFVGSHLLRTLLDRGHQVRCLVRDPARLPTALAGVEPARGDIREPATLAPAMRGVDVVIHLVGIILERRGASFEIIHTRGTENVVAAAQTAGVRRVVHMSALGTRPNAASRYHQTKWRGEETVRASGLSHVIFRPSIIFGPGDGFVTTLADLVRKAPVIPVVGPGTNTFQPIFVGDVALAFAQAAERLEVQGTFDLGGAEQFTFDEVFTIIADTLRVRKARIHIPIALMKPLAFLAEALLPTPPVTSDQLINLGEDNVCDIGPMQRTFHLSLTPFRDGIRTYLRPVT